MRDTIRLGRIAGIPIGINWSILAVAAYLVISLTYGAFPRWWPSADLQARLITSTSITVLFFASILGHELGHAAAARRHHVEVDGITLWVLGGIAKLRRQAPTPKAEFEIAFAGPAVSLLLGAGFAVAALSIDRWSTWGLAASAASWLAITNAFLGVSNLIPVSPLDGGRVLTALLWRTSGNAEGARLSTARAGLVLGSIVVIGAVGFFLLTDLPWWVFLLTALTGAFVAHAAWREIIGAVLRSRLERATIGAVMQSRPPSVASDISIEHFLRATATDGIAARPVVHWDAEPVGYVSAARCRAVPDPERSWTPVSEVMIPVDRVMRAWSTESVAEVLERCQEAAIEPTAVIVVHDPANAQPVGTVTPMQIDPLFAPPNPWGVAPDPVPTATVPVPLGGRQ